MIRNLIYSFALYFICMILICLYCAVVYFTSHALWQEKSQGSLIIDENKQIRGSVLIAQNLKDKRFFSPRTSEKFDSSCDVALYNDKLRSGLLERYRNADKPYDISSLTPSASLVDPYIMKRDAIIQAIKIAKARNINPTILLRLIDDLAIDNSGAFFDLEIVNTTILNSELLGIKNEFSSQNNINGKLKSTNIYSP
jgi:potassium-transporting ATPase KdpC subunit